MDSIMERIHLIILFAFVAEVRCKGKFASNLVVSSRAFTETLVDTVVDVTFDRAFKTLPFRDSDLQETSIGQPVQQSFLRHTRLQSRLQSNLGATHWSSVPGGMVQRSWRSSAPLPSRDRWRLLSTKATDEIPDQEIVFSTRRGGRMNASQINVAVFGGGSFGTAMACVLGRKGVKATLVVRRPEVVDSINNKHLNPYYQSDLLLPTMVRATLNATEAFGNADFIFHAVPVQFSRKALQSVKHLVKPNVPIVSLSKGIETSTLSFMSDILVEEFGPEQPLAYLSGPSFAAEIVRGVTTAVTVASASKSLGNDVIALFSSPSFRALYTPDIIGVEVGGAVKNVVAIAAGMCEGLGLGRNSMAALVTRGCSEMRRLVVHLGGNSSTVFGLSGVGDTFGTCFGPLSRNRQVGLRIAKGETLEEITGSMTEVAEGVATSRAVAQLIQERVKGYRIDLKYPILTGTYLILNGTFAPSIGAKRLMEEYPLRLEEFPF